MNPNKKILCLRLLTLAVLGFSLGLSFSTGCSSENCPLGPPFCEGDFPLNTQLTTQYGPPWVDVVAAPNQWITCFGPYALCYYADCAVTPDSDGTVADCPCFEWFGTNHVLLNSILNDDLFEQTKEFCTNNPDLCTQPNQAPVCAAINSGTFFEGSEFISTFGFYMAAKEPIGSTDCTSQPGPYAGCMTAPCLGPTLPTTDDGTAMLTCQCPIFDGPFQVGRNNLSCDISPLVYSAAFNPATPPSNPCDLIEGCIPDLPESDCGCGLYDPGTTTLPPDSGVDCNEVCNEYDSCQRADNVELGYTCDATVCTSNQHDLVFDACLGLQKCDLTEIFKAEKAAGCSCCASQLCNCMPNLITNQRVGDLDQKQRDAGETPQCDINGTLCGN